MSESYEAKKMRRWRRENPEKARAAYLRYRNAHIEDRRSATRRWRDSRRHLIAKAKHVPCARCGETYLPEAMDFHHRDPSDKAVTIGAGTRLSLRALLAEIAKCDVVCANCHRIITVEDRREAA